MENRYTISVLVTGLPANARQPMPLPGESMFQFVIRNYQQEWHNFVDSLFQGLHLPNAERERFLHGRFTLEDSKWSKQIEHFMNSHLPTASRTLQSLAELRDNPTNLDFKTRFSIKEILWLKKHSGIDKEKTENVARDYGVRIIEPKMLTATPYGYLPHILDYIQGDLIWIVPAGTYFLPLMTAQGLTNVIEAFAKLPELSFFCDDLYTIILRTIALRDVLNRGYKWPDEPSAEMELFRNCGYRVAIQRMPLVELEPIYGGEAGVIDEVVRELREIADGKTAGKKPWWKFW